MGVFEENPAYQKQGRVESRGKESQIFYLRENDLATEAQRHGETRFILCVFVPLW
jgi:hypothetical protein